MPPPTLNSEEPGYRAYSAVRARATHVARHRCPQDAGHFAHDTALSAFFAEVVCDVGTTLPRTVTSPPRTASIEVNGPTRG